MSTSALLRKPGTYLLLLRLETQQTVSVGKLGEVAFPRGYYLYVGSALGPGGIEARLSRHLRKTKKPHWHIDYLREKAEVEEAWSRPTEGRRECEWVKLLTRRIGGIVVAKGFGSSDCRCPTHLFHYAKKPDLAALSRVLRPFSAGVSPDGG